MIELRILRKRVGTLHFDELQYLGASDPILIDVISDAPKDALIAMTDNGLAYYLPKWQPVPIVEEKDSK